MLKIGFKSGELAKLQKQFDRLERGIRLRVGKKAVRAGAKPILDDMKARAPRQTGALKRSIKQRVRGYRRDGIVVSIIGVASGIKVPDPKAKGGYRIPSKYAHLVEYGTAVREVKKAAVMTDGSVVFGKRVRGVTARPFIRPSFDSKSGTASNTVRDTAKTEIEAIAKSL